MIALFEFKSLLNPLPSGLFDSSFKVGVSKLVPKEKNKLSDELIEYDNPKEGLILSRLILLFESIPIELISYLIPYLKRKPVLKEV